MNVLPSVPPADIENQLYPNIPSDNFQLTEKKAWKEVHYSAVGLGAVAAALSSGAIAASLTGIGIVVGASSAGVAASTGAASMSLTVLNKKLDRKVDKHSRLHSLGIAKHDTINSYV